ncbi:MAG: 50S ribosomal protein L23 [Planctomycetes bacterium]|nr:50S ribosomal protein L23 [Planctomycetota bacterium]
MDSYRVIKSPHVSEKGHEYIQEHNTYVFKVDPDATKTDIKAAIKELWGVDAVSIRTVNMIGKAKRFGRLVGKQSPWKKAVVRVKDGQAIEALR